MINITNETAAREARELAHDLTGTALSIFSRLPNGRDLCQLLDGIGVRLNAKESRPLFVNHPHETVELIANDTDIAGPDHKRAVHELTEFRTADLHDENGTLTADGVGKRQHGVRIDLTGRRDKLSAPLSVVSRLPGLRARGQARRTEQQAELVATVTSALSGVPLSVSDFDDVSASVLSAAGLTADQMPDLHEIKALAVARHREFRVRWETVLMLAWEAIATDESGADAELDVEGRRHRFGVARAEARQAKDDRAKELRAEADEKAARERAQKKAEVMREIEERRKQRERTRWSYFDPDDEREPEEGLDYPA